MTKIKKKPLAERIAESVTNKALETARLYDNPTDCCLMCGDAKIQDNLVAVFFRKLGWDDVADKSDYKVVQCNKEDGRYVANPKVRQRWCPKK